MANFLTTAMDCSIIYVIFIKLFEIILNIRIVQIFKHYIMKIQLHAASYHDCD